MSGGWSILNHNIPNKKTCSFMLGGIFLLSTIGAIQFSSLAYASSDAYDSGYNHGCDDAERSESDKYINQPEKGPSFHTGEFMDGYYAGLNACSSGGNNSGGHSEDDDDGNCKFGPGNCGHGSCYARGVEDGKNNDFGDFFKIDPSRDCDAGEFFPRYYEGFIDGCMSVEGNTRDVCESATDA